MKNSIQQHLSALTKEENLLSKGTAKDQNQLSNKYYQILGNIYQLEEEFQLSIENYCKKQINEINIFQQQIQQFQNDVIRIQNQLNTFTEVGFDLQYRVSRFTSRRKYFNQCLCCFELSKEGGLMCGGEACLRNQCQFFDTNRNRCLKPIHTENSPNIVPNSLFCEEHTVPNLLELRSNERRDLYNEAKLFQDQLPSFTQQVDEIDPKYYELLKELLQKQLMNDYEVQLNSFMNKRIELTKVIQDYQLKINNLQRFLKESGVEMKDYRPERSEKTEPPSKSAESILLNIRTLSEQELKLKQKLQSIIERRFIVERDILMHQRIVERKHEETLVARKPLEETSWVDSVFSWPWKNEITVTVGAVTAAEAMSEQRELIRFQGIHQSLINEEFNLLNEQANILTNIERCFELCRSYKYNIQSEIKDLDKSISTLNVKRKEFEYSNKENNEYIRDRIHRFWHSNAMSVLSGITISGNLVQTAQIIDFSSIVDSTRQDIGNSLSPLIKLMKETLKTMPFNKIGDDCLASYPYQLSDTPSNPIIQLSHNIQSIDKFSYLTPYFDKIQWLVNNLYQDDYEWSLTSSNSIAELDLERSNLIKQLQSLLINSISSYYGVVLVNSLFSDENNIQQINQLMIEYYMDVIHNSISPTNRLDIDRFNKLMNPMVLFYRKWSNYQEYLALNSNVKKHDFFMIQIARLLCQIYKIRLFHVRLLFCCTLGQSKAVTKATYDLVLNVLKIFQTCLIDDVDCILNILCDGYDNDKEIQHELKNLSMERRFRGIELYLNWIEKGMEFALFSLEIANSIDNYYSLMVDMSETLERQIALLHNTLFSAIRQKLLLLLLSKSGLRYDIRRIVMIISNERFSESIVLSEKEYLQWNDEMLRLKMMIVATPKSKTTSRTKQWAVPTIPRKPVLMKCTKRSKYHVMTKDKEGRLFNVMQSMSQHVPITNLAALYHDSLFSISNTQTTSRQRDQRGGEGDGGGFDNNRPNRGNNTNIDGPLNDISISNRERYEIALPFLYPISKNILHTLELKGVVNNSDRFSSLSFLYRHKLLGFIQRLRSRRNQPQFNIVITDEELSNLTERQYNQINGFICHCWDVITCSGRRVGEHHDEVWPRASQAEWLDIPRSNDALVAHMLTAHHGYHANIVSTRLPQAVGMPAVVDPENWNEIMTDIIGFHEEWFVAKLFQYRRRDYPFLCQFYTMCCRFARIKLLKERFIFVSNRNSGCYNIHLDDMWIRQHFTQTTIIINQFLDDDIVDLFDIIRSNWDKGQYFDDTINLLTSNFRLIEVYLFWLEKALEGVMIITELVRRADWRDFVEDLVIIRRKLSRWQPLHENLSCLFQPFLDEQDTNIKFAIALSIIKGSNLEMFMNNFDVHYPPNHSVAVTIATSLIEEFNNSINNNIDDNNIVRKVSQLLNNVSEVVGSNIE